MHLILIVCLVFTSQVSSFYNVCHSRKNAFLSDDECSDLFFEPSEKETKLGSINLRLNGDSLSVTPEERSWNNAYLRVTMYNNQSNKLCNQLSSQGGPSSFCIDFAPQYENDTFLLEYKAEKLPETGSRKFLMTLPKPNAFIFPYVDFTDTSRLVLKAQKLVSSVNVSYYQVEAFKEKHNTTNLLDLRLFDGYQDVSYELFTYNDEGEYYFMITVFSDSCEDEVCSRQTTPVVYIGRKSTRLVIGIVGASLILPVVLFIFHMLPKNDPTEENRLEQAIMVAYKSSFKKHNDVVVALATLLERLSRNQLVELVDLAKNNTNKKFSEKFCVDALLTSTCVVYVAPPRGDPYNITVDKLLSQNEVFAVVFDHCTDKLPPTFENRQIFRLFDDFDRFLRALNIDAQYENSALYADLKRKTEEARLETDRRSVALSPDDLPKIVVTVEEPQEYDALITNQVSL